MAVDPVTIMHIPADSVMDQIVLQKRSVPVCPSIAAVADIEHPVVRTDGDTPGACRGRYADRFHESVSAVDIIHVNPTVGKGIFEMTDQGIPGGDCGESPLEGIGTW